MNKALTKIIMQSYAKGSDDIMLSFKESFGAMASILKKDTFTIDEVLSCAEATRLQAKKVNKKYEK